MKKLICLLSLATFGMTACGGGNDIEKAKKAASPDRLRQHTEAISSDSCQGRKPFSEGADRAVDYIAGQMREIGLSPVDGSSYFQPVNIVSSYTECSPEMVVKTPKGTVSLKTADDFIAFSARIEPEIAIKDAELVFAGYGIVAPEYGKNDYAGIENPQDKVAIVMVNDPGLGSDDQTYFKGDIMTYYGRWMYKYEEAAPILER